MGSCLSSAPDAEPNAEVNRLNAKDKQDAKNISTILLLGAGESGKSTLMKQMISLYGTQLRSEQDRSQFIEPIRFQAVNSLVQLAQFIKTRGTIPDTNPPEVYEFKYEISSVLDETVNSIVSNIDMSEISDMNFHAAQTPEFIELASRFWRSDLVKQILTANSSQLEIPESSGYFLSKYGTMFSSSFIPSLEDCLRVRKRTTGVVTSDFALAGYRYRVLDVGGQRSERRKWIQCFEEVDVLFYLAAISEYDQVCFEDRTTNRIQESLELFHEVSQNEFFKKTAVVLFLNKIDLFRDKFRKVPLQQSFPDFNGTTEQDAYAYFESKYRQAVGASVGTEKGKAIVVHCVSALDSKNVDTVFKSVQASVIRMGLTDVGAL